MLILQYLGRDTIAEIYGDCYRFGVNSDDDRSPEQFDIECVNLAKCLLILKD